MIKILLRPKNNLFYARIFIENIIKTPEAKFNTIYQILVMKQTDGG